MNFNSHSCSLLFGLGCILIPSTLLYSVSKYSSCVHAILGEGAHLLHVSFQEFHYCIRKVWSSHPHAQLVSSSVAYGLRIFRELLARITRLDGVSNMKRAPPWQDQTRESRISNYLIIFINIASVLSWSSLCRCCTISTLPFAHRDYALGLL